MSYFYFLASDIALEETSFGVEVMSIKEAVNKGLNMPNFFDIKDFSEEELREPEGAVFLDDRGTVEVDQLTDDMEEVQELLNKKYVYEITINATSDYVYIWLYEYLRGQYQENSGLELWQLLMPEMAYVEGREKSMKTLRHQEIKDFFDVDEDNARMIFIN